MTKLYLQVARAHGRMLRAQSQKEWSRGGDPADWPFIDAEYSAAKKYYKEVMRKLRRTLEHN
jgi:hypothetical protein